MENSPVKIERRGLVQTTGERVGQRLSQTGAMIKERGQESQKNVGAGARRGGFSVTGSQPAPQNWKEVGEGVKNTAVKGGPIIFWLVAGIAVIKDLIDVGVMLFDLLGAGLTATAIGAPLGVLLVACVEIFDKFAGMIIDFTIVAYFAYIGGGLALRLTIMSVGALIDMIPIIDVLPLTTISFFAAYLFGKAVKSKIASTGINALTGGALSKAETAGKLIKKFI